MSKEVGIADELITQFCAASPTHQWITQYVVEQHRNDGGCAGGLKYVHKILMGMQQEGNAAPFWPMADTRDLDTLFILDLRHEVSVHVQGYRELGMART